MSTAVLHSRALIGVDAPEVAVEIHLANGLPAFSLVGLPETEVKEARERVRAALLTTGYDFPNRRVTVNLAPADLPKASGRFDLPIALGILAASGQLPAAALDGHEFAGELGLTGELRPIRGALVMACAARRAGRIFVLPAGSADEAAIAGDGLALIAADTLATLTAHFDGRAPLAPFQPAMAGAGQPDYPDLGDVRGQGAARRALEIAAAGTHSLLLCGPPGTGKSMLAARLPGILPPMHHDEALATAAVHALVQPFDPARFHCRPYRTPHHSSSAVALVGGGSPPRPGEISLAHNGVLFLDELPEFERRVLENLREPMERGHVDIARAAAQVRFPARFQFIAAMNPCPCGYHGHPAGRCRCSPEQVGRYRARLSGPLLDRIDLWLDMASVPAGELLDTPPGEPSDRVRQRVVAAHRRQTARQGTPNGQLEGETLARFATPDPAGLAQLREAIERLQLSARACHRILRVARTVADLDGCEAVACHHVAEAIQYRRHSRP